ncbi:Conserved hypothetical protein [Leptospira biflexa serovar Patoc strain 'Patoc 1 (Ames)']|uniref:Uncharacterized protein n=1 Tax=Leptospira biflexa serovar Patoc (strain Patoc 1 / ATCC 23582 / Paris) TaxID=456481 RepID=B0SLD1_LEPBP|nr:hypothetical protein [Leptospira biflexa]ABZ93313.1 Conserved hypothetical protein [Leptospira biflexa serovar Patoc strain 'Patoc 1 (Ames)']ABZ96938.1 Conserved hypothetical protein [Leptospira biflexa serovar Patoc strain 'Patoc 1 (Paris)']
MADQEKNKNEDLENIEPILDEDSFSLDLDDFDLGDDDLEVSPGIEAPNLDDISAFDEEDDSISDMVASSGDYDDILDIDLDSDLNLLGEEDPILHDEDIHADFSDYEDDSETETPTTQPSKSQNKQSSTIDDEDLELEFDDDLIDLDKEIEAILNGEDGILTSKKQTTTQEEEDEGPISLSLEELENITGSLPEEEHSGLPERELSFEDDLEEEHALIDEHSDLDLDLDDSEIDTTLAFDEEGKPQFDLTDYDNEETFVPQDDLGPGGEEETSFKTLVDPEEEELFGHNKEDENLTLSDEELGSILGAGGEASLEETLASEEEFFTTDDHSDLPSFTDEDSEFDLLGGEFEPIDEKSDDSDGEEEEEGPLTLSLEELENISGGSIPEEMDEPTSDLLSEEIEDESITLSADELGSIIANDPIEDDETDEDHHELDTDLGEDFGFEFGEPESDADEPSIEGLEGEMEGFESSAEEEDEGPIALSLEELDSIAADAEEVSEEELVDSLDRAPLPYEEDLTPKSDLLAEEEEDESIALSMEELENITATEEEEGEITEPSLPNSLEEEMEDDVTLSPESLDAILGEELPGEGLEDIANLPEEEEFNLSEQIEEEPISDFDLDSMNDEANSEFNMEPMDDIDLVEHEGESDFGDLSSDSSVDDSFDLTHDLTTEVRTPTLASDDSEEFEVDLDEYAMEGKLSPLEELRKSDVSAPEANKESSDAFTEAGGDQLSVGDRKKVLGYLDNLLGNLPDEVIREFSKSQYFELYKKMMKELEI